MPKKLNVSSNERVDLPDFIEASNTFTEDSIAAINTRILNDGVSRTLNGFRVVIEDQTISPGQITVYNGDSIDHPGRNLHNEDQENASISITLTGANQTFYVELQYIEGPSDSDYRAFWDPTAPNASPIPNGQEVAINVATRISKSWTIVTPVSTTGFDVTTNPSSSKIPLCILRTNGTNVIGNTQNANLVQVAFSSVLGKDAAIGDTSIRVLDSRLFGNTGNITIDYGSTTPAPQTVAITANDRVNNILTINPALTAAHLAGAIVRDTGTGRLIKENTNPNDSNLSVTPPNHIVDRQLRFFQGDETRGAAMYSSKENFGFRDDLNIRTLKDHTDFLAAQIREIKFGRGRADTNSAAPPTVFPTIPRYFDAVGGLAGARTAYISIGDGTNTFGDFNGGTDTTFTAAVAAARAGTTVFIKPGSYAFSNTVSIPFNLKFVTDGIGSVTIQNNVTAGPLFSCTSGNTIGFKGIQAITGTGTANMFDANGSTAVYLDECSLPSFTVSAASTVYASRSTINSTITSTAAALHGIFDSCTFSGGKFNGILDNVVLAKCTVSTTSYLANFTGTSGNSISLIGCKVTYNTSVPSVPIFSQASTSAAATVHVSDCTLILNADSTSGESVSLFDITAGNSSLFLANSDCTINATNTTSANRNYFVRIGQAVAANGCKLSFVGSTIVGGANQYIGFLKNNLSTSYVTVSSCSFSGYKFILNTDASSIINVSSSNIDASANTTIGASLVTYTNSGVLSPSPTLNVSDSTITGPTVGAVALNCFSFGDAVATINNNVIRNFVNTAATTAIVTAAASQASMVSAYLVNNNKITGISNAFSSTLLYVFGTTNTSAVLKANEISNCTLTGGAIYVESVADGLIESNIIRNSSLKAYAIAASSYCSVLYNTIRTITVGNATFSGVLLVTGSVSDAKVIGNLITNLSTSTTQTVTGISCSSSTFAKSIINNNVIDSITSSIGGSGATGIFFGGLSNGSVSHNIIRGIGTTGSSSQTIGLHSEFGTAPFDVIFEGNTIESHGTAAAGNYAIRITNTGTSKYLKFIGNTINSSYIAGQDLAALDLIYINNGIGITFSNNDVLTSYGINHAVNFTDCVSFNISGNKIQGYGNLGEGAIYVHNITYAPSTSKIQNNHIDVLTDGTFAGIGSSTGLAVGIHVDCTSTGFIGLNISDNVINYDKVVSGPVDFYGIRVLSSTVTQRMLNIVGNTIVATSSAGYFSSTGTGISIENSSATDYLVRCVASTNNVYVVGTAGIASACGLRFNKVRFLSATGNAATSAPNGTVPGHTIEILNCAGYFYTGNILGDAIDNGTFITTGSTNPAPNIAPTSYSINMLS